MKPGIPVIVETTLPTHIPVQALVFAGGIGSRMENKDGLPKHMLPIDVAGCKRPLIASILDKITVHVDQIVVGVGYRASQVVSLQSEFLQN